MQNDSQSFNANRLCFARKRRGVTRKSLANKLGMSDRTIAKYEKGESLPKDDTVQQLSEALDFPSSFFFLDNIPELDPTGVSFRSLARTPAPVRDAALCAGQIALEFSAWLEYNFSLPAVDLPDCAGIPPQVAAEIARSSWGIGELPISNMVHLLESKGFLVFSLCEDTLDLDAYSFWMGERPYIFLNTKKSIERSRFDAAHELGHILLHRHAERVGKEAEKEANMFASSFLMPTNSVSAYAPSHASLGKVYEHKKYWKVSAAAYVKKLYDIGRLSEWHYRSLMIELSKRGELKKEPEALGVRETSKLMPLVFHALREEGKTKNDIAAELCVLPEEINSLLFGLAMIGMNGSSNVSPHTKRENGVNHLRRVK